LNRGSLLLSELRQSPDDPDLADALFPSCYFGTAIAQQSIFDQIFRFGRPDIFPAAAAALHAAAPVVVVKLRARRP
jgi:hypothetical protein